MSDADQALERRARNLYARYGYVYTAQRLKLTPARMKELLIDTGAVPCPASHLLATWVAGAANRPLQSVHQTAGRDGVLRRTEAPNAARAGACSVPKAWAETYIEAARQQDKVEELVRAGWLTSRDVAERFDRAVRAVNRAAYREGPLAIYLDPVDRETATQLHAWEPRGVRTALDAYRELHHHAQTRLVPLADIREATGAYRQHVNRAVEALGITTCHAPNGRREAAYVRPRDAQRLKSRLT